MKEMTYILVCVLVGATMANTVMLKRIHKSIDDIAITIELVKAIEDCEGILNDPHHCVSVCVEEFQKMGC